MGVLRTLKAEIDNLIKKERAYADRKISRIIVNLGFNPYSARKKYMITYRADSERKSENEGRFSVHMLEPYSFFTKNGARRVANNIKKHYSERGIDTEIIEKGIAEAN